jgi:tRNA pseudouridine55 synthase
MDQIDGVLVIDKPPGITSHDVVATIRKLLGTKTGHLGTLDPAATGVLPLVLGRATRLARFMQSGEKEYWASIKLGRVTNTYDGDGQTVQESPVPEISSEQIDQLLSQFRGELRQLPPMFSAVKVDGERLYKAARRGETRQRPSRTVTIHDLELLNRRKDSWDLRVRCSAGTYIRSLAHDLGEKLGCGAYLEQLRRTKSGDFHLSMAVQLDTVEFDWEKALISIDRLLPEIPIVNIDERGAKAVVHGNPYFHSENLETAYCRLFHRQQFLAIGKVVGEVIQPEVVLRQQCGLVEGS